VDLSVIIGCGDALKRSRGMWPVAARSRRGAGVLEILSKLSKITFDLDRSASKKASLSQVILDSSGDV